MPKTNPSTSEVKQDDSGPVSNNKMEQQKQTKKILHTKIA
jgi:hypothetical protein